MTCKDCIHYEACDIAAVYFGDTAGSKKFREYEKRTNVELPCAVGDTIYTIYSDEDGSLIEELTVSEVTTQKIRADYGCSFRYGDIGKTVFLTKEEAEKTLKESEQE